MIQATVAVYPIGQPDVAAVDAALRHLRVPGVELEVRAMQTELLGPADAETGGVVMTVTVSNACPVPGAAG